MNWIKCLKVLLYTSELQNCNANSKLCSTIPHTVTEFYWWATHPHFRNCWGKLSINNTEKFDKLIHFNIYWETQVCSKKGPKLAATKLMKDAKNKNKKHIDIRNCVILILRIWLKGFCFYHPLYIFQNCVWEILYLNPCLGVQFLFSNFKSDKLLFYCLK